MKESNVIFEIKNKENPYLYKGIATIDNDVIRYKDEDSNVLFDMKRNILIKKDKEKIIKLDLDNKIMRIKLSNIEVTTEIVVLNIKKNKNKIEAIYRIDENEIKLSVEIED